MRSINASREIQMEALEFAEIGTALMTKGQELNALRSERDQLSSRITSLETEVSLLLQKHNAAIAAIVGIVLPKPAPVAPQPVYQQPYPGQQPMEADRPDRPLSPKGQQAQDYLIRQIRGLIKEAADQGTTLSTPEIATRLNVPMDQVRRAMLNLRTGGKVQRPPPSIPMPPLPVPPEALAPLPIPAPPSDNVDVPTHVDPATGATL